MLSSEFVHNAVTCKVKLPILHRKLYELLIFTIHRKNANKHRIWFAHEFLSVCHANILHLNIAMHIQNSELNSHPFDDKQVFTEYGYTMYIIHEFHIQGRSHW